MQYTICICVGFITVLPYLLLCGTIINLLYGNMMSNLQKNNLYTAYISRTFVFAIHLRPNVPFVAY